MAKAWSSDNFINKFYHIFKKHFLTLYAIIKLHIKKEKTPFNSLYEASVNLDSQSR